MSYLKYHKLSYLIGKCTTINGHLNKIILISKEACHATRVKLSYRSNYSPSITAPQGVFDLKEPGSLSQTGTNVETQTIQTCCDQFAVLTQIHRNAELAD